MTAPALFVCPHCGVQTEVAPDLAGRSGHCFNCGKPITLLPPDGGAGRRPAAAPTGVAASAAGGSAGPGGESGPGAVPIRRREAGGRGGSGSVRLPVAAATGLLAALVLLAVFAGLIAVVSRTGGSGTLQYGRRPDAIDQIRQIQLALEAYHGNWGSYPPQATYDAGGRPLHSWRTLILPELGQKAWFDEVDLDKPWDDPDNMAVLSRVPNLFHAPDDVNAAGQTSYVVFVGDATLFPGQGRTRRRVDGLDAKPAPLLVIEAYGLPIAWFRPVDPPFAGATFVLDGGDALPVGAKGRPALAALADGTIVVLDADLPPVDLRTIATADGRDAPADPRRMRVAAE